MAKDKSKKEFSLNQKVEDVLASRLSEEEKAKYVSLLNGDKKVESSGVSFEIYASVKGLRGQEKSAKEVLSNGKSMSIKQWDKFFINF